MSLQLRGIDRAQLRPTGDGVIVLSTPVSHLPSSYATAMSSRVETAVTAIHSLITLEDPLNSCLLTRPANILLYGWRGDRHSCVDLLGVSPA